MIPGHAIFAPSSAARWTACPPSATLAQGLPERTSAAAEEGTRVHSVIQRALQTGELPPPLAPWVPAGKNMPDHDVARYMQDYVRQLGGGKLLIEERVVLAKGCWGQIDIGHVTQDIITVGDYKNGSWDVEAKNNKQALTYAATFLDANPTAQWFRVMIFQPNSWASGSRPDEQDGFKQHVHSRAEVEAHRQLVASAMAYEGPPLPGPHCRWCPAFSRCPAMSQDANFLMAAISRNPDTLLPNELLRMLRIIRSVSDMKAHLESILTARMVAGAQVPGAELKTGVKWRAWNDDKQAADTLYRIAGHKGVKPVSPSAAGKLSPEAAAYVAVASHKPEGEQKVSY
jgi:hypothetical protein